MRQKAAKPKVLQSVGIPSDLANFLSRVHQQILYGDEATLHESDDMLQSERVYGGLVEEGDSVFGFTYFPGNGIETKWELLLDNTEIARIASGQQKELSLWVCQVPSCGNKFTAPDETCFVHDYEN